MKACSTATSTRSHAAWQLCALLWAVCSTTAAAVNFNVYGPCEGATQAGASVPQCRRQAATAGQQAVTVSAVPKELPIDMRMPCEAADIDCFENVDVTGFPVPPAGPGIANCSHELMPWSPFPCSFNSSSSYGLAGQQTDLCYITPPPSAAQTPNPSVSPNRLATNLTTDGYNNVYYGVMPDELCSDRANVVKMLLTLDFRLASGRQFDRTYSFQIGQAVAALGTCSEPSRLIKADKYWSVTVDVTHLQSYLGPGMPTRFSLANVLSNTYNVPIWAKATLTHYYNTPAPNRRLLTQSDRPAVSALSDVPSQSLSNYDKANNMLLSGLPVSNSPKEHPGFEAAIPEGLAADVPTEVVPLVVPDAQGFDSLVSVAGDGDRPDGDWPSMTFQLPASLSQARNIYRAQMLVVPKANGCEEFWAMNPPASQTESTCGDVSTGEPYREVRVHVDGQLAGFYPIYYTMYTGGVDPRLWTAIVASHAYSLPVYTFDLGPWLGLLNTPIDAETDNPHNITVEIFGATGSNWVLANTLLIWRSSDPDQIVTADRKPWTSGLPDLTGQVESSCEGYNLTEAGTCVTEVASRRYIVEGAFSIGSSALRSFVSYETRRYSNVITFNNTAGTAAWNQRTRHTAMWLTGSTETSKSHAASIQKRSEPRSSKRIANADEKISTVQATSQKLQVQHRFRSQRSTSRSKSHSKLGDSYHLWSGKDDNLRGVLTQNARRYDWVIVGGQYDMAPYVFSFNETLLAPTVYAYPESSGASAAASEQSVVITGKQRHYQHALMVDVYDTSKPACVVPTNSTHTAVLDRTIGAITSSEVVHSPKEGCVYWSAACAFCSPSLMKNELASQLCAS